MKQFPFLLLLVILGSCTTTHYYIVRHAEKADTQSMTTDVPLSAAGTERAIALREALRNVGIRHIYSTNTIRTKATAAPLGEHLGIGTQTYDPRDSAFINRLQAIKENTLVVGHSNTVDDLVNSLTGGQILQDLVDTQYGDLFVVTRKGKKIRFEKKRFGK